MLLLHRALASVGGAAAGGGWTPADLGTDLIGWYKADAGVTESGGAVSQWDDQSGLGEHLVQSTAGAKPTYSATGFNGSYPGISFDGSSDYLDCSSFGGTSGTALSFFAVATMRSGTDNNARLIAYAASGTNDFGAVGNCIPIYRNAGTNAVQANRNSVALNSTAISLATNYRLGSIWDGTNHNLYVNNAATGPTASSGSFTANVNLRVGADFISGGAFAWWDGVVAEIVIAKKALDSTERSDLDSYFTTKWGL